MYGLYTCRMGGGEELMRQSIIIVVRKKKPNKSDRTIIFSPNGLPKRKSSRSSTFRGHLCYNTIIYVRTHGVHNAYRYLNGVSVHRNTVWYVYKRHVHIVCCCYTKAYHCNSDVSIVKFYENFLLATALKRNNEFVCPYMICARWSSKVRVPMTIIINAHIIYIYA